VKLKNKESKINNLLEKIELLEDKNMNNIDKISYLQNRVFIYFHQNEDKNEE